MEETKTMKTPMSSSIKLNKDEKGKSIDSTMYKGMIGSLLYLIVSRPDIMYSVCLCARFQSCPKESHLSVVKRILKYLKGTMDIGLCQLQHRSLSISIRSGFRCEPLLVLSLHLAHFPSSMAPNKSPRHLGHKANA
ncbi:hypothetical protein AAG906_013059 [Vitis piasezkii]